MKEHWGSNGLLGGTKVRDEVRQVGRWPPIRGRGIEWGGGSVAIHLLRSDAETLDDDGGCEEGGPSFAFSQGWGFTTAHVIEAKLTNEVVQLVVVGVVGFCLLGHRVFGLTKNLQR